MPDDTPRIRIPVPRTDPLRPADEYLRLLRDEPVCPVTTTMGERGWLVTRNEDLRKVLTDRRFSRAAACLEDAPRTAAVRPNPETIVNMDPPDHSRIRRLAAQAFTPARIARLRPRIEAIVDELLDDMAALTPPVDFNAVFARPLPLRVICEMLGIPFADRRLFLDWARRILTYGNSPQEVGAAYLEMRTYFFGLVAAKRVDPGEDLLSALTLATDQEGAFTESECVSLGTFLLIAGYETTFTVMTTGVVNLLTHPEQLADLRQDRSLMPHAVEEVLRMGFANPSLFPRIATTDVTLRGVTIPAGSLVLVDYDTALRDPEVYDDPETFDIRREPRTQVYFGHGPHFCLGASVARAELELGLWGLFRRFPTLELAVAPSDLRWKDANALGGYEELPLTW